MTLWGCTISRKTLYSQLEVHFQRKDAAGRQSLVRTLIQDAQMYQVSRQFDKQRWVILSFNYGGNEVIHESGNLVDLITFLISFHEEEIAVLPALKGHFVHAVAQKS